MVRSIQDSKVKTELKVFVCLEFHLWKFLKQFLEHVLRYKGTDGWTSCGVDGEGGKRLVSSCHLVPWLELEPVSTWCP